MTRTANSNNRTAPPPDAEQTREIALRNEETAVRYRPLAESDEITLTIGMVMHTVAVATKNGHKPNVSDCIKFMSLCKARGLNPFVGDAYLIGYDSNDGPTFTLITAIQALRKRAEGNPSFDGAKRGVIVKAKDGGEIIEREGAMMFDGEILLGGWSEVYRKDYRIPFRETVKLSTYDQKRSRWRDDPEGMIAKIAEAAALRRAFPSDVAGLYLAEEFRDERDRLPTANGNGAGAVRSKLADLAGKAEPGAANKPAAKPAGEPQDRPKERQAAEDQADATAAAIGKVAEYRAQLSRAMKISDVDAVMTLANSDKSLGEADYEALNDHAQTIVDHITAEADAAEAQ